MFNDSNTPADNNNQTFSVSQLNRKVKSLLETHFPLLWVEGEISNLSRPASGHWYFTLKDPQAQVSCAMFKRRNGQVKFAPQVGDHIKVRARISLYEGRGDYQLIIEHMEQAGFGLLQKRFNELQQKLQDEGLFEQEKKKPLPSTVQHLAVVTSPTGAAIQDVLSVLARRFPAMQITIIPSQVQGDEAPSQLIKALQQADKNPEFDAILLCRGGGSIEDLWAFNNEALARTIAQLQHPIISAVGHEVDFTIADFVADIRAPTPSVAAELLSPNQEETLERFHKQRNYLHRCMQNYLNSKMHHVENLSKRLKHPRDKLDQWHQRLDQLEIRLTKALTHRNNTRSFYFNSLHSRLTQASPAIKIKQQQQRLSDLQKYLLRNIQVGITAKQQNYERLVTSLDIVSPLATLRRGYSITADAQHNILHSVENVEKDDKIHITLDDGELQATVEDVKKN